MRILMYLMLIAAFGVGSLFMSPVFSHVYSDDLPQAIAAGDEFLRYYSREDYPDIYRLFDAAFTAKLPRDAIVSQLRKERAMTGALTTPKVAGIHHDITEGKAYFTIVYSCLGTKGRVSVTMALHQETTWKISSYSISIARE
jgi:hypothetical protein